MFSGELQFRGPSFFPMGSSSQKSCSLCSAYNKLLMTYHERTEQGKQIMATKHMVLYFLVSEHLEMKTFDSCASEELY